MAIPLAISPRAGVTSRELDWDSSRAELRGFLGLLTPISINKACERVGIGRKHACLRANEEVRAIADWHFRYRESLRRRREDELKAKIGEFQEERLKDRYEGISAREIWSQLDREAQSVSGIFRHINLVLAKRPL